MIFDNEASTPAGLASEDADDRAEALMRKSLGTRPGGLAFIALAIFTALSILGSIIAIQVAKDQASDAVTANCESSDASNRVLAQVIGELTAPRVLAPTATPEEVAFQEEANRIAAENREEKLAELMTSDCDDLGDISDPQPIPIPEIEPPPVVIGPNGEIGPAGLTGLVGPAGAAGADGVQGPPGPAGAQGTPGSDGADGPPGPQGTSGSDGLDGSNGFDGTNGTDGAPGPVGPVGPQGPQGEPAPTTIMPPPPPDTTTTTMPNLLCDLGLCSP